MDKYKIEFSVKENAAKKVVFSKEFQELKDAFAWGDWFKSKHAWVGEYKIRPIFERRRKKK